jgi:hypothetical protein
MFHPNLDMPLREVLWVKHMSTMKRSSWWRVGHQELKEESRNDFEVSVL